MLKKFIAYYKPYRKMLFWDMLASLFISLIGMVYPIQRQYKKISSTES